MESPRKKRVFVLGLDGATFDIIKPLIDEGALPNLAAVMKQGAHAKLNSTILHHSPPAWTTFATGKNPGKHGILGFTRMSPHSYKLDLVYGAHNRAKTMWEVLGETGKKVIVMNIPMTYPPKAVNGILLSGLDTPSTDVQFTHPPDLREEILRVSGPKTSTSSPTRSSMSETRGSAAAKASSTSKRIGVSRPCEGAFSPLS